MAKKYPFTAFRSNRYTRETEWVHGTTYGPVSDNDVTDRVEQVLNDTYGEGWRVWHDET